METVGSIPEILENDREGWIIHPGDLKALERALFEAAMDRPKLTAMQSNAYLRYRKSLCLDAHLEELAGIYQHVLRSARKTEA